VATLSTTNLTAGSHSITATYNGSATYDPSTSSPATAVNVTVTTTTGLVATVNGAAVAAAGTASGSTVVLTATMNPLTTTGSVTFMNGSSALGAAQTLSSGIATLTVKNLPTATNSLTAVYGGTAPYTTSTSPAVTVKVIAGAGTTTTLGVSSASIIPGANETLTATVTSGATGSVTFFDGSTALGGGNISGTTATFATTTLAAGAHSITATYNGNAVDQPSTSTAHTVTVATPSATALAISAGPYYYGANVTFTATVTPSSSAGSVTFLDNGVSVGTGTLSGGIATLTLNSQLVGSHPMSASYTANGSTATSSSMPMSIVATTTATSIAASGSATKTFGAASFTLTATVTPSTVSMGSVTFYDTGTAGGSITNAANLGKIAVTAGSASVTITATQLAIGKHYLVASYGGYFASTGAAQFTTSMSSSAPVAVNGPTALTVTASNATVAYGAAIPTITPTYAGFINSDTSASLTKQPTCTTTYTTITAPGTYATANTCSGAVDANYTITYPAGSLTVTQATPAISHWYNQSAVYGTPVTLSATTNSTATVTYALVSGPASLATLSGVTTLTPTGVGAVVVSASVAGTTNYTALAPVNVTVTVNQAPLVITASSPATLNVGGTVPTITATYATFVHSDTSASLTTQPTCSTTYKANSAAATYPTNCSGAVDPNYSITYAAGSFAVTQAAQTIKGFYASSTTYGVPVTFTATSTSGSTVVYSVTSGPGSISGSILTPTGPGTVVVAANVPVTASYAAAPQLSVNVTVYQAQLTVTASSPASIPYGSAAPGITASYSGWVNGDSSISLTTQPTCFTLYTNVAASHPGSYTSMCYGAVDPKYSIAYTPGAVTVIKANPSAVGWPTSTAITYGAALSTSGLSGGSSTPAGSFAWTTGTTVPHVGGAAQSVTFTPTDITDYNTATGTASITVAMANPTVTWPTASTVTYNALLSSSKLSGGSANGTFGWTNGAVNLTTIGPNSEGVTFTPTDTIDYNNATGTVSVSVNKATPAVIWPTASGITYGAALSTSTLSFATGSGGAFAWTNGSVIPPVGTDSESVTFTPTDTVHYTSLTSPIHVTVSQATAIITWPSAATAITYGQALSASHFSGQSANTAGTFTWTAPTTTPIAGTDSESVTFTPTNLTEFSTSSSNVNVLVNPATPTVTVLPTGSSIAATLALSNSTLTPGTVTGSVPGGGTTDVNGTFAWTGPTTIPAIGTASYPVTFTSSDPNYSSVSTTASLTVNACGLQDGLHSSNATGLNVYIAGASSADASFDAEGLNESAICAVNSGPSDQWTVTFYPTITSGSASSYSADSNTNGTNAAILAYGTEATVSTGATIILTDDGQGDPGSITTDNNSSSGVFASMGGTVTATDVIVNTFGNGSYGLKATNQGTLTLANVTSTTYGNSSAAIAAGSGGGNITSAGGNYTSNGTRASGVRVAGASSSVVLSGDTVTAMNGTAITVEGGNSVSISGGATISGALGDDHGIFFYQNPLLADSVAGTGSFTMSGGSLTYACDATDASLAPCPTGLSTSDQNSPATLFSVANTAATITLTDVTVTNTTPTDANVITGSNGTLLTAAALNSGTLNHNGGNVTFDAFGEILTGDIIVDSLSSATISLAADSATPAVPSTFTGAINNAHSGGTVSLTLDATSTWVVTGDSYLTTLNDAVSNYSNITCQTSCTVYVGGVAITLP
jgi:hypothetical protein